MPDFALDTPNPGAQQAPQINTITLPHALLLANYKTQVPVNGARHVTIDNRLARTVQIQFETTSVGTFLTYLVDPNSQLSLNFGSFSVTSATIFDLYQQAFDPTVPLEGELGGVRSDEQLPFRNRLNNPFSDGGFLMITTCDRPIIAERSYRPVAARANWAQSSVAAGAGTIVLSASTSVNATIAIVGAGYFNLVTFINPTASAYVVTIYPVGSGSISGQGYAITIQANSTYTAPIECESLSIAYTAANQQVIAFQTIINRDVLEP